MNTYDSLFSQLNEGWRDNLKTFIDSKEAEKIINFLNAEKTNGYKIFPDNQSIFRAFEVTKWDNIKAVILGQDPYHNDGQAEGLAFSVPAHIKMPPSLKNIFKELQTDLEIPIPLSGSLLSWAQQGVLLLNTTLTVRAHAPLSHKDSGWNNFSKYVIKKISDKKEHIAFVLWGQQAQSFLPLIDAEKHFIHTSAHPSPLSAYNGFWNSKPFSKINSYFQSVGIEEIDWRTEVNLF